MPILSAGNDDGYFARGIIERCDCGVSHAIVDIELTRDGGLYGEWIAHSCGKPHLAQQALDCGEINESEPHNYVMVDPGYYAEEIHAVSESDAICQMIRWAEIEGHPYTGTFSLRTIHEDGEQGSVVYQHESERGGEQD